MYGNPVKRNICLLYTSIGMADGVTVPSCFSILEIPGFEGPQGDLIALSDTAVNINPTSEELADIAVASAKSVKKIMDWEPRVAMLSFSTCGSAKHECADKVAKAVSIAQAREPELMIDGEMQLDAAIRPNIAERKIKRQSKVAGKANVLVFPNLDAGNIGTKLLQCIGNAQSYGGCLLYTSHTGNMEGTSGQGEGKSSADGRENGADHPGW